MTLKCKWHIKMKLQYVDNAVASLLMELLTLQMFAEELSVTVKWEKIMEIEDILNLNPSSTLLLSKCKCDIFQHHMRYGGSLSQKFPHKIVILALPFFIIITTCVEPHMPHSPSPPKKEKINQNESLPHLPHLKTELTKQPEVLVNR